MKKWFGVSSVVAMALGLCSCAGCTRISPGMVGIKSTVIGSDRGLRDVAVGPDWVFYNFLTESVFEYPTSAQTVVWTQNTAEGKPANEEITFTNKDRMQINADISLGYQVRPEKAAAFYLKFRSDDLDTFTNGIMRNWAREKFDDVGGKYGINEIMGDNAKFLAEVRTEPQKELDPIGITLIQFGFIGAPRPPAVVIESINMAIQATQIAQQKQNELVQSQADAAKEVAKAEGDAKATLARAESQAKANQLLSNSITPTLVQYRMLDKWNGAMPTVQAGGGGLILSLPSGK